MTTPLVCVHCGYTLTGLAESGACPECATQIERTIRTRSGGLAAPEHLQAARKATTLVVLAVCLAALNVGAPFALNEAPFLTSLTFTYFELFFCFLILLNAAAMLTWLGASWRLAMYDPTAVSIIRPVLHRAIRWTVLASLALLYFVLAYLVVLPPFALESSLWTTRAFDVLSSLSLATNFVQPVLIALQAWGCSALMIRILRAVQPSGRPPRAAVLCAHGLMFTTVAIALADSVAQAWFWLVLRRTGQASAFATPISDVTSELTPIAGAAAGLVLLLLAIVSRRAIGIALRERCATPSSVAAQ